MKDLIGFVVVTVLSLLGIAAVVTGAKAGINAYNVYEASSIEGQMSSNILTYLKLAGSSSASGLSNAAAINADLVPDNVVISGTTLKGPWNGSTVTLSSLSTGGFQSAWAGVGASGCAKFAASQHPAGGLTVNGTSITVAAGTDNTLAIASACNAASGNTATIVFRYPL
jgi:hypothetical protein